MALSNKPTYALAIIAHPDDEAFLLAGTCMKFAQEGKHTAVVCATRGEKGADRLGRDLTSDQMAQIRTKELEKACSMIDCDCVEMFDYPDGSLDQVNFEQLASDLILKIDQYQPEIILTFGAEGFSGHRDHIVIGQAAKNAASKAAHRAKEIWLVSIPASILPTFLEHFTQRKIHHSHFKQQELVGVPDEKLLKIDIREFAQAKHNVLKAHESQYIPHLSFELFLEYEWFERMPLT